MEEKVVAIYLRVSSHLQTTDRQETELVEYANKFGLKIFKIYKDIISGFTSTSDRVELLNLIYDAKLHKFNMILFSEFTRLGRSQNEIYKLVKGFNSLGIELYFQKQNTTIGSQIDKTNQLMLTFLSISAESEIQLFVERSISGKISKIKKGEGYVGGLPPFGYKVIEKKMIVDEKEAELVKRIFNMYYEGTSTYEIAQTLNNENIDTIYTRRTNELNIKRIKIGSNTSELKFENTWNIGSINNILKSRIYIGERTFLFHMPSFSDDDIDPLFKSENQNSKSKKTRKILEEVKLSFPQYVIINEDLFESVQKRIYENYNFKNNNYKIKNLLKSKIKCGACGGNYSVLKQNEYQSYRCYNSFSVGKSKPKKCYDNLNIRQSTLNGLVLQLSYWKFADFRFDEYSKKKSQDLMKEFDVLTLEINKLNEAKKEIEKKWVDYFKKAVKFNIPESEISKVYKDFKKNNKFIDEKISNFKYELNNVKEQNQKLKDLSSQSSFMQIFNNLKNNRDDNKTLIDKYIDKIIITPLIGRYSLVQIYFIDGSEYTGTVKSGRYRIEDELFFNEITGGTERIALFYTNEENNRTINFDYHNKKFHYNGKNKILLKDEKAGDYSIEEFLNILERNNCKINHKDFEYNDKYL